MALIDSAQTSHETFARRYLVTSQQFQDVFAQETGRSVGYEIDLAEVRAHASVATGAGRYDLVLYLGDHQGWPMFTFTTPDVNSEVPKPPSSAYRKVVVQGLRESHGLTTTDASSYIDERIGT